MSDLTAPPFNSSDAPTAGRIEGRVHLLPVRVYYEDTDFSGVVYHARYLHFLERARTDFLRLVGVVHTELLARPDPVVLAVSKMTLAFRAPARIDDALVVATTIESASGARMKLAQEVRRGGQNLLDAQVEAVSLTPSGRPRRIPEDIAAVIAPLVLKNP